MVLSGVVDLILSIVLTDETPEILIEEYWLQYLSLHKD